MSDDNPKTYDQAFFLDLARPKPGETHEQVRERWNAWRREPANKDVAVTFEGVDFTARENKRISFEKLEFGDWAQLGNTKFGDFAQFSGVKFGRGANFEGSAFGISARFDDAVFDFNVRFVGATFGERPQFWSVAFGVGAQFDATVFVGEAQFYDATFGSGARFVGATFGGTAAFDHVRFEGIADFSGTTGDGDVGAWLERDPDLDRAEQARRVIAHRADRARHGFSPATFSTLSFSGAHFRGDVSFARRSFERPADFTGVRFDQPPDFDGVTNLQRIDFTGARAGFASADRPWWKRGWTTDSTVAIRLRALRSQIEATKNHDFERDLYIEERKAERGIHFDQYRREKRWGALAGHCLWIGIMGAYWALSDYGRSWLRPAAWLVASIPAFHFVYAGLLSDRREAAVVAAREAVTRAGEGKDALTVVKGWKAAEARVLADYDATVGQLAVSNAVPFVGPLTIDPGAKTFLYCGVWPAGKGEVGAGTLVEPCRPIPPPWFQAATIAQNLLSILLVFFIGLALRNYFRLK